MAANVGNKLNAFAGAHQCAAVVLLCKRGVVAHVGYAQDMSNVTRAVLKNRFQFALIKRIIKIA